MITNDEIIWTYRILFGREPENPDVIAWHSRWPSLASFVRHCLNSAEFSARRDVLDREGATTRAYPLDGAPPIRVESHLPASKEARMWGGIQRSWESFGDTDPYWSVITDDRWRISRMSDASAVEAFYSTGRTDLARLDTWFARAGLANSSKGVCAEYGCGVGRVTGLLASRYSKVRAFDISASHLEAARRRMKDQGVQNVEFVLVRGPDDLGALAGCDLFFSFIVLQHNPPPIMRSVLSIGLSGLNSGGIAFFQIPTYMAGYEFDASAYLKAEHNGPVMEMHCLPQRDVLDLLHQRRCLLREVQPDWWIGQPQRWLSHTFLAQRCPPVD